jgi:hypothetical protein
MSLVKRSGLARGNLCKIASFFSFSLDPDVLEVRRGEGKREKVEMETLRAQRNAKREEEEEQEDRCLFSLRRPQNPKNCLSLLRLKGRRGVLLLLELYVRVPTIL